MDKLGCFVFADGDRYEGHFKWGMMHGYGVYYWANDRATYFGNWDNNSQSGCGVKFFNSGAVEYGEWKDDQYLGSFTGVCGREESWGAMNNALDVAQRARMFKYKPDSEVTLMRRGFTLHQDPVVYQEGTEWQMPGWRGETFEAPTAEELESQHPRLYAQMQRHNEIWERAWRYYNLDLKDALEEGVKRRSREEAEAEARVAGATAALTVVSGGGGGGEGARGVHGARGAGRLRRVRRHRREGGGQEGEEEEGEEGEEGEPRRVHHAGVERLRSQGGGGGGV